MKVKTSVTLSYDVLAAVDALASQGNSRSAVIERVLRDHFARRARVRLRARELDALNRQADRLNVEAANVLEFLTSRPNDA